jgi:predicted dinucleotide-binding enzyme
VVKEPIMKIQVIGAGNVGSHVIRAAVKAGHTVTVGVRNPEKIQALLDETGIEVAHSAEGKDLVISTLPYAAAAKLLPTFGLDGKVVVDASNPLGWADGPTHAPAEGHASGGAHLQALMPGVKIVKAFNTFGAELSTATADADRPLDHFIAGDDAEAKALVSGLLESLNMRPIDLGPIRNAATLEHLAIAWIHLAMPAGWGRGIQLAVL